MALAAAQVGSVIGKGGAIVKQIRENTGTRVRVVEPMPGSDDRVIVISGLEDPQLEFHGIQVLASDRKHSTPAPSTIWDILNEHSLPIFFACKRAMRNTSYRLAGWCKSSISAHVHR